MVDWFGEFIKTLVIIILLRNVSAKYELDGGIKSGNKTVSLLGISVKDNCT